MIASVDHGHKDLKGFRPGLGTLISLPVPWATTARLELHQSAQLHSRFGSLAGLVSGPNPRTYTIAPLRHGKAAG